MVRFRPLLAWGLVALIAPATVSAQNTILSGVVRSETQSAVRGAFVSIPSLELSAVTNDQGSYRLTVPAEHASSQVTLMVSSIGYRSTEVRVQLEPGAVTRDVTMSEQAISLDELLVTGTAGRQERRAQPATVTSIDAARIAEVSPVQTIANVLQSRTPGVMLRSVTGSSGTGQVIRVRGSASIGLSNNPLVIIDGIGSTAGNVQEFGVGNAQGSRLNDLRMEDIESIEIVKGPAAAALYGSDAAAGVINIITKRGRVGSGFTQSLTVEYGEANPNFTAPDNFARCAGSLLNQPGCQGMAEGTVIRDNPLVRENAFGDGRYRNLQWSLRGGGANYTVFLSVGGDEERGTLPNNEFGHVSSRANFAFIPSEKLSMDLSFWLGRTTTQLPHNDNNIYGWLGGGFLGNPATRGGANDGWYGANRTQDAIGSLETFDKAMRVQPRASVQYTPVNWFTNSLVVGADISRVRAYQFWPKNSDGWFDSAPLNTGQISERRRSQDRITINYLGNFTWNPLDALRGDFALGAQVLTSTDDQTWAQGQDLVTNDVRNVNAAGVLSNGGQEFTESRQVGVFGQADIALNEKLYLQAGVRIDRGSVFGADSKAFVSPGFGLSYVISDEPFFSNALGETVITSLRLRGAFGAAGKQPTSGVLATYNPTPFALVDGEVRQGATAQNPGNPDLRPERSRELELGFEAGLLNDRLGFELAYFHKTTTDVVVFPDLPGSLGFSQDPWINLGKVLNRGFELSANARVLTYENVALELRGALNTLHNEILDQGGVPAGAGITRDSAGFPIGGIWDYNVREIVTTPGDSRCPRNTAGEHVPCAIVSNDREFIGNPQNLPGWEWTFSPTLTVFRDLSFHGLFDARGDFIVTDGTAEFRDRQLPRSELAVLGAEAYPEAEVLSKLGPFITEDGQSISRADVVRSYRHEGNFVKLREVSANYRLPRNFVQRYMMVQTAQLTFGLRNLNTWTDYPGLDPETGQFLTVPQDRRWTVRLNVTF